MLADMSLEQFKALAKKARRVAVSREIYGDRLTPITVFQTLSHNQANAALLDSSDHSTSADACIYLGFDPVAEFCSMGKEITLTHNGQTDTTTADDPIAALRTFYQDYKGASLKTLAKFAGGMIGFMSYDAIRLIEAIPDQHNNTDHIPDIQFTFYGTNIVFDKRSGTVTIAKMVEVNDEPEKVYSQAIKDIDAVIEKMLAGHHPEHATSVNITHVSPDEIDVDVSDEDYKNIVKQAKKYIQQGDAFQIVPSRRFQKKYTGDDFNIYRALRVLNPSPYQFYIRHKDFTIVGSSPERLVSLQNGVVETMPIAGTRPRGENFEQDQALEKGLLEDEKEIAEHMMLVDLGRNDVGAISKPGSVRVEELASIKRFSRVMHIVSRVQGHLRDGFDAFDVLKAAFPAGTLSGAPKIRAMEIIDNIETSRRGVYGGTVCAIDNEGQMDSCITIRTAFVKDGVASVRAGGGVVLDSDPQLEADETRHKAQAVLDALALAQGGFV